MLFILKSAYREFVDRVGDVRAPRGSKTEQVLQAIRQLLAEFTLAQLEQACPGVSRDMVRRVLREQSGTLVACRGRGLGARWVRLARGKR